MPDVWITPQTRAVASWTGAWPTKGFEQGWWKSRSLLKTVGGCSPQRWLVPLANETKSTVSSVAIIFCGGAWALQDLAPFPGAVIVVASNVWSWMHPAGRFDALMAARIHTIHLVDSFKQSTRPHCWNVVESLFSPGTYYLITVVRQIQIDQS